MRQRLRIGGLSLFATTTLLGAYVGYPGLKRVHAAACAPVTNESTLITALGDLGSTCDTITISASTITLTGDLPNVTGTGPFSIRGSGKASTIIDGAGAHSAFAFTSPGTRLTMSGLTIRDTTYTTRSGPAIYVNGDLNLHDFAATANSSSTRGGAIYSHGDVTITDSTFTTNASAQDGGAIFSRGAVRTTNATFTGNDAAGSGGAVFSFDGVRSDYTLFDTNDALGSSGGAVFATTYARVHQSTFTSNTADNYGGGMYSAGTADITDSTFSRNSAIGGGAVYGDIVTAANSTFSENTATGRWNGTYYVKSGAAIYAINPGGVAATIENSTFYRNQSPYGPAVYAYGDVTINFSTIVNNTSTGTGYGAVYIEGGLTVTNSVIYGNLDGANDARDLFALGSLTVSTSLLTSSSSFAETTGTVTASDLVFGDPELGSLGANGGPTNTMMPAADSPVIGRANPIGAPALDQRGYTRTTRGRADMGSVEREGVRPDSDPSQVPPAWLQSTTRPDESSQCPPGMNPSWAQWPHEGTGGWTCEWTTWWDVHKGTSGGWVTTPGFDS